MKQKIITNIKYLQTISDEAEKGQAMALFSVLDDSLDLTKGCGLSAIQIGFNLRVAIIRLPDFKLNLWNPKIIEKEKSFMFTGESCLSLPGLQINTKRYYNITIENGDGKKYNLKGLQAVVVQHEIDHMNGLTMLNRKWRHRK